MNTENMRDKIGPWLPALFCAALAITVTIGNLWVASKGGSDNAMASVFILFMPMCFFYIGAYLTKLKNENAELRDRLEVVDPPSNDA